MAAVASRYIDARTLDYVVYGAGLQSDTGFTSKVVLALKTRLGSCLAFPGFGSKLHLIQVADERGRKLAEKYAWQALQHLIAIVDSLKAEASLTPFDPRDEYQPGQIYIRITGKRGSTTETARYTAAVGSA